jgi:uncharacterized RDD family membrane protein YckC
MQNTGLLRRFAAIIYDCLLVAALLFLATIPFIAIRGGEPVAIGENTVYQVVLAVVIFLFFTGYWTWRGRTLGMQSWGLQLETMDGTRLTFARASIRFFAAILSWAALGLGFLWQLWDEDKLAWHDRISGTRLRYYPKAT